MEIIIIALIAVEVIIVLIREGPELFHKLASPLIGYISEAITGRSSEALPSTSSSAVTTAPGQGHASSRSRPEHGLEVIDGDESATSRRDLADRMLDSIHWNTQSTRNASERGTGQSGDVDAVPVRYV